MSMRKKVQKQVIRGVSTIVNTVSQAKSGTGGGESSSSEIRALCRKVGAEGIVLLKNKNGVLPLSKDRVVSVFGRVQKDWFYVGYGSGGDVNPPYKVSLLDGLRANRNITVNEELAELYEDWCEKNAPEEAFWGAWEMSYDEMPISKKTVQEAAHKSDTAVVVIGRAAGEDRENSLTEGSYYLTNGERSLLSKVCSSFRKTVVVLNCGSIMDMSWVNEFDISAVLYAWQGGMESGNSVADVLSGDVSPSGKLADTIAEKYAYYPSARFFGKWRFNNYTEDIYVGYRYFETFRKDKVLFPFGFGLSYTRFETKVTRVTHSDKTFNLWVDVKNIGGRDGKYVGELYLSAPQGMLGKPSRVLVAYEKTKTLAPGETQKLRLSFNLADFASYDDSGATGNEFCYVLEKGEYKLFFGSDVRSASEVKSFTLGKTIVTERLTQAAAPDPKNPFDRLKAVTDENGKIKGVLVRTPVMKVSLKDRILENLPQTLEITGDLGYKLADVQSGKVTLEQFTAQLSFDELEAITRGGYVMNNPLGAKGNAGVMGGVLPSLRDKGVPPVTTTDGPSGIRLAATCSLLPNGAVLACSFNKELIRELYSEFAKEMLDRGSDIILAPGMNIHRNPLCGRNFEYFSEDPLLSGLTAAAVVLGVQENGVSACPKHFACNNQEVNRTHNDSRVSERALREIYLKGFEFCVKTAKPKNIMTSYNKINGVWGHYHYDLVTTILRKEWGYEGNVMTDWWMRKDESHEFPGICDQGYRVRAGIDVLMPGGARTGKKKPDGTMKKSVDNGLTTGEIQACAMHVLKMAMETKLSRYDFEAEKEAESKAEAEKEEL